MKIAFTVLMIWFMVPGCYSQQSVKPVIKLTHPDLLVSELGNMHFTNFFYYTPVIIKPGEQEKKQVKKTPLQLGRQETSFTIFPGLVMESDKNKTPEAGLRFRGEYTPAKNIIVLSNIYYSQNAEINYSSLGYRLPFGNILRSTAELKWVFYKNISSEVHFDYLYEESPGIENYKFFLHQLQTEFSILYPGEKFSFKFSCLNFLNKTTSSQREKFQIDLLDPGAIEDSDPQVILPRSFRLSAQFSL